MTNASRGAGPLKERPWGTILVAAILLTIVVAFVGVVILDTRQSASAGPPEGTEEVDVGEAGQHTESNVDYDQTPPAGGDHNAVWQNCGVYEEPVRNETSVHSLEHGAVWITYRPDLPESQVSQLEELAQGESYMLVSPMEGLPSPIVASAWGNQIQVDSASSEKLEQFKNYFLQGPQTPEPGAACSGGVGEPA